MSDLLEIHQVTVGYGEGTVLSQVDMCVSAAGSLCVLGRNGIGKTTLVKTLMGLIRPRTGRILFDDRDITACRRTSARGSGWVMYRRAG